MAESTKDVDKSHIKHSKTRQSLGSAFGDPLQDFKTPIAIRKISEAIDNQSAELEGRIRKISDSSDEPIGDEPDRASLYIDQRQELIEDIERHNKEARKIVRETYTRLPPGPERNVLKRALTELEANDPIILKERAALAANRMRVKYSVLGRQSSAKIGEAYMMALTDNLPEPANSSYKKKHARSGADQSSFRNRLIKTYDANGAKILEVPRDFLKYQPIWCPISGKEHAPALMKAAHIVPYSIGETNAAYLFGVKPHEGYNVIWSEKNGLLLNWDFEKRFDDGRIVIMPDPTDENEFISIVLCQELLKEICPAINAPYSAIHRKRLEFQTTARPGKRYLYMHALLTLFRRRRYNVPGWEKDREQVFSGQIWATPKKWARKSIMEVLALEIGDIWGGIEGVEGLGLGEFPDAMPPEEEKRIATLVKYGWETRARGVNGEEDEDEDEDEDDDDDDDDDDE
ncbi:hypothetical protein PV04_08881 [Phialophora macrospora]|uniref:HNH nuclease domain-containing protein n=1 Tax=Phialophora macrospora TaxID=1851006 RepID=A0A0D2DNT7_9EURO|nr:hypothetical protein PV04_08881 [Phialophora macrospora]